jgi:hypothetical protein
MEMHTPVMGKVTCGRPQASALRTSAAGAYQHTWTVTGLAHVTCSHQPPPDFTMSRSDDPGHYFQTTYGCSSLLFFTADTLQVGAGRRSPQGRQVEQHIGRPHQDALEDPGGYSGPAR